MDKINIFWIEDNPLFGTIKGTNNETRLSAFKARLPNDNLFSFTLFQHPKEVAEFLDMTKKLSAEYSNFALKCLTNIPDIVVFDYKLAESFLPENLNNLAYEDKVMKELLVEMSASKRFKLAFSDYFMNDTLFIDLPIQERIKVNVEIADKIGINAGGLGNIDDEFGLFCGLSIIREFKESITCGVPATIDKKIVSNMNINSAFFEWINEYDLQEALEKEDRASKNFNENLIPFAVNQLRKKIKVQIEVGKIQLDLNQLIKLSSPGELQKLKQDERIFSFTSVYGTRHLPLNGLFIDKNEGRERDKAISDWADDLLKVVSAMTDIPLSEYQKAISLTDKLWKVYIGVNEDFDKRQKLSELFAFSKSDNPILHEELSKSIEKGEFMILKDYFGFDPHSYKLTKNTFELTDEENRIAKRLAVLFLYLKLTKQNQIFKEGLAHLNAENINPKGIVKATIDTGTISPAIEKRDILMILFPVKAQPLILDMHQSIVREGKRADKKESGANDKYLTTIGLQINGSGEIEGLASGEKIIGRYYANSFGIKIPPFLN